MKKYAVIVAGGSGQRMGSSIPKQFLLLKGKPVFWYTLTTFLAAFDDLTIILVLPAEFIEAGKKIVETISASNRIKITTGGHTRYQSVKNGLRLVENNSIVFVHDAVRCLVTPDLIKRCYDAAIEKGNAVPAIASVDSIRIETTSGNMVMNRNHVRMIQTPQTFLSEQLLNAFDQPFDPSFTDEATVVENTGIPINLVEGEMSNIKITSPVDLLIAEKIMDAIANS